MLLDLYASLLLYVWELLGLDVRLLLCVSGSCWMCGCLVLCAADWKRPNLNHVG